MSELREILKINQTNSLSQVRDIIAINCGIAEHVDDHPLPVLIKKGELRPSQVAANAILDGLLLTLGDVGVFSAEQSLAGGEKAKAYESVARAVENIAVIARNLAEDRLILSLNEADIQRAAEEDDQVFVFQTNNCLVSDKKGLRVFNQVRVFIRPELTKRLITKDDGREKKVVTFEKREPRLSIRVIPSEPTQDEVVIRVDNDNAGEGNEIKFDLVVGHRDSNTVDQLIFSSPGSSINTLQTVTHHFSSKMAAEDFGATFEEVMLAYRDYFVAQSKKPETKKTGSVSSKIGLPTPKK